MYSFSLGASFAMDFKGLVKSIAAGIGSRMAPRHVTALNSLVSYLEAGRWMREHGFTGGVRARRREELFDRIAADVGGERTLYLEFGVWRGAATRYWSRLLRHPESHLHGFDSFEGLPETWDHRTEQGTFSTGGAVPQIADPRVTFFPGWFDQTLINYTLPDHDRLVVNCDADLYSSTRLVLDAIGPHLKPGDYLYFDEFYDRHHELRAFDEFLGKSGQRFQLVGATRGFVEVAFQRA
jgi:hypothetical protein